MCIRHRSCFKIAKKLEHEWSVERKEGVEKAGHRGKQLAKIRVTVAMAEVCLPWWSSAKEGNLRFTVREISGSRCIIREITRTCVSLSEKGEQVT